MPVDTGELRRRFEQVRSDRSNIEGVWNDIDRFISPLGTSGQRKDEKSVEWKRAEVWDFTAIDGAQKLAANIHGTVCPPGLDWYGLEYEGDEFQDDVPAREHLDKLVAISRRELEESDFHQEIASALQDLVAGNTFLVEEPARAEGEWNGLDFTAVPVREGFFEPGAAGEVEKFYRLLSWTGVQIVDKFKDADREVPERVRTAAKERPVDKFDVVFAVYERPERRAAAEQAQKRNAAKRQARSAEGEELTHPLAPELRPVGFVYFLLDTGEQLGDEGGYYEMPVCHTPWERTPGSIWGHGPAMIVLPTVKYLNALLEADKVAREKMVDPVTMVTERGLLSDVDHRPGGLVVVRSLEDMKVFESGAKVDVTKDTATELRSQIRQLFHVDELQMKDSPAMTATEASIRWELMNRLLGPTVGRIETTLLGPVIRITLGHLARAGKLPRAPENVRRKNPDVKVNYTGPIARSRRTDDVAGIERVAAFVAALSKMGFRKAQITFDDEKATRLVAKYLGCPAALLRSEDEVKKITEQEQKLAERAAKAEASRAEGEAAKQHVDTLNAANEGGLTASEPASPMPLVAPTLGAA